MELGADTRPGGAHRVPIAVLVSAVLAKLLLERWLLVGGPGAFRGLFTDAAFVGVVLAAGPLVFGRRIARSWLTVSYVLLSATMLTTAVYADYFEQVVSPDAIAMAGQAGQMTGAIFDMLRPVHALFAVDLPFVLFALWLPRRSGAAMPTPARVASTPSARRFPYAVAWLAGALLVLATVFSVAGYPGPLDGLVVSREKGVFAYQLAAGFHEEDLEATLSPGGDGEVHPEDPEWVQTTIDSLKGAPVDPVRLYGVDAGSAAGASVIMIQVEALSDVILGTRIDDFEVTPSLNALRDECWYFPNTLAQIGAGNTADAEFVVNTSLLPAPQMPVTQAYVDKTLPGLPRVLGAEGYSSATFHTNDATFWNRTQLYPALGFDTYYDAAYFGSEDTIWFGASDEVLFDKSMIKLEEMRASGDPFYAQLITVTSHYPFTQMPERKDPYRTPEVFAGTEIGSYLPYINYADRALGEFIEALKANGMWDECVIVIYGDHTGLPHMRKDSPEEAAQEAILGRSYTYNDRLRVPLLIHLPGQTTGMRVEEVAGQMDIMPTVCDLLGVSLDGVPHFGRSLFSDEPVLIPLRRYVREGSVATTDAVIAIATDKPAVTNPIAPPCLDQAPTTAELDALDAGTKLLTLSDAYVRALRVRPDYDPDAEMVIPVDQ